MALKYVLLVIASPFILLWELVLLLAKLNGTSSNSLYWEKDIFGLILLGITLSAILFLTI